MMMIRSCRDVVESSWCVHNGWNRVVRTSMVMSVTKEEDDRRWMIGLMRLQ